MTDVNRVILRKNVLTRILFLMLSRLLSHWLKLQNENIRQFLTSRKQEKLNQHSALEKSKVRTLSPTTIWNDYRPQDYFSFTSPSLDSNESRDRPEPKCTQLNRRQSTLSMHGSRQVGRRTPLEENNNNNNNNNSSNELYLHAIKESYSIAKAFEEQQKRLHDVHRTPLISAFSRV